MGNVWAWAGVALALGVALSLRPWRMDLSARLTPLLATLAVGPLLWAWPQQLPASGTVAGLPLQLSGAGLVLLMLGWPLAVLTLAGVAVLAAVLGGQGGVAFDQYLWAGLLPCTLALGWGALLRRWLPSQVFVYILGRGFFGTALCLGLSGALHDWALASPEGLPDGAGVARWLMARGDAFLTGLLVAVFVAFKPQWLATWSDGRYLKPPAPPGP